MRVTSLFGRDYNNTITKIGLARGIHRIVAIP